MNWADEEHRDSLFAPQSVEDVVEWWDQLRDTTCECDEGRHLNMLHDLVVIDVPWLIRQLIAAEAERDRLARTVQAVTAIRDRVSDSVAISAQEGRKLKPVVSLAELDAVLDVRP